MREMKRPREPAEPPDAAPGPTAGRAASRVMTTAAGTHQQAFGPTEWALLAVPALVWGLSFFFIAVAVDDVSPGIVAFGRILFGALALAAFPAARRPMPREEWRRLAFLAVTWMAVPFTCFSIAEQWIDSSLAGMLNGAVPLSTAAMAAVVFRRPPTGRQLGGLLLGFAGVVLVLAPALDADAAGNALGVGLVLLAVACYGMATNVSVPVQQTYGPLAVTFRSQLVALALTAPYALAGVPSSHFTPEAVGSLVVLGALGTGVAFVALGLLLARVGATRGTVGVYFTPLVAVAAGVIFLDEQVAVLSLAGVVLVLAGAWLVSRAERAPAVHLTARDG